MKTIFSLLTLPILLTCGEAAEPPATSSPYAPIAFLVGGRWHGDAPPAPNGAKVSLELAASWASNRQGIHFDSEFINGDKHAPYTSGMYYWSAARKQLLFIYTDASGSLTEGTVTTANGTLVHEFTVTDAQAKVEKARAIFTPRGANSYTSEIFISKEGKWDKIVEVHYERTGGSAPAP